MVTINITERALHNTRHWLLVVVVMGIPSLPRDSHCREARRRHETNRRPGRTERTGLALRELRCWATLAGCAGTTNRAPSARCAVPSRTGRRRGRSALAWPMPRPMPRPRPRLAPRRVGEREAGRPRPARLGSGRARLGSRPGRTGGMAADGSWQSREKWQRNARNACPLPPGPERCPGAAALHQRHRHFTATLSTGPNEWDGTARPGPARHLLETGHTAVTGTSAAYERRGDTLLGERRLTLR